MVPTNSLDVINIIATLTTDVYMQSGVSSARSILLTQRKLSKRYGSEGIGFLTKTLPALGKALDSALSGETNLKLPQTFARRPGTQLPMLFGELFELVFSNDGKLIPSAPPVIVASIRQLCFCFYKYEAECSMRLNKRVIDAFIQNERELTAVSKKLDSIEPVSRTLNRRSAKILTYAKRVVYELFSRFDPSACIPRHGPGAVADKLQQWQKFQFKNIPPRVSTTWPIDAFFCASINHYIDTIGVNPMEEEIPARVILVPKDSRGPRLISAEPSYLQWLQQGIMTSIVQLVEHHRLTACRVNFSNQTPNRLAALYGSRTGKYATLDLKDASDRVSMSLVRLLFPANIVQMLESVRSTHTRLPDGSLVPMQKHAPMGSALCFPIMAISVFALLHAAAPDADTRERILVYGDDIVVPVSYAGTAIRILEEVGLLVNSSKCCIAGFFRESCGLDAYKGIDVTPLRFRTRLDITSSADHYTSWCAYATSLYRRGYMETYVLIVRMLLNRYGYVADETTNPGGPSVPLQPFGPTRKRTRYNKALQKLEYLVLVPVARRYKSPNTGYEKLLRYFTEGPSISQEGNVQSRCSEGTILNRAGTVCSYTPRNETDLLFRWR